MPEVKIDTKAKYVLLPVHEEGITLEPKILTGKELLQEFKEEYLINALESGECTLPYKGNEYFLDEIIDEKE